MSFDRRDIRRSMDVFTLDNAYLGTVLEVEPGPRSPHGERVPPSARQSSAAHGERLGPASTDTLGSTGPNVQTASAGYRVAPDSAEPIGQGSIKVGKWWGLRGSRSIPVDAVLTVSLERVVLKQRKDEL